MEIKKGEGKKGKIYKKLWLNGHILLCSKNLTGWKIWKQFMGTKNQDNTAHRYAP